MPTRQKRETQPSAIQATGIRELDALLHGGIPRGSVVLLSGSAGTGKTILALQWLFAGFTELNESGVYISFTESVSKVKQNIKQFRFYQRSAVSPVGITLTDLRAFLKGLGLQDAVTFTRDDIRKITSAIGNIVERSGAKRVVIDSVTAMAYRLREKDLFRDFIFELGTTLSQTGTTAVLTSEVDGARLSAFGVEEFISDGIILLSRETEIGNEQLRTLKIIKLRGTSYDEKSAFFRITDDGLRIFPRFLQSLSYETSGERVSSGIEGLDEMLGGGFFEGSVTVLSGASGTGKTNIALQFTAQGVENGEKTVYVSFEESPDHIRNTALRFGWDLGRYETSGDLRLITSYAEERHAEEHLDAIIKAVIDIGANRLVIDSLSALEHASKGIVHDFSSRLTSLMKERNVTTLLTVATPALLGAESVSGLNLSSLSDNIIILRFIEIASELHHGIIVLKVRGSAHDNRLREIKFTDSGAEISTTFTGYEGVLTGSARRVSQSLEEQLHDLFLEYLGPMGARIFAEEKAKGLTLSSLQRMIRELGEQGILSERRKAEFVTQTKRVFGTTNKPSV